MLLLWDDLLDLKSFISYIIIIMIIMNEEKFVGREDVLEWLEGLYREKASLAVIYGRRRVGKTELVKRFASGKPHVYFLATEKPDLQNMKDLQGQMALFLEEEVFNKIEFGSWEDLFVEFMKKARGKIIIILDEFPYLIGKNKAIPSIFQKIWDLNLSKKEVCLILLGSSIGMMETHVLNYRSPLYGRRSGQWELKPLPFKNIKEFYPEHRFEDRLKFFGFTGGIAGYLKQINFSKSPEWNIANLVFKKGSYLYEEAETLLRQELREPSSYFQILQAISEGCTKYGEICNRTGFKTSKASQYIKNLINLRIVKKSFPVTQKKTSRYAIYRLSDNYYKFWFAFVYPNRSLIEDGKQAILLNVIQDKMKKHESFVFEEVCAEFLWKAYPVQFTNLGGWWEKDKEIDLVGINEKTKDILFVECKWSENVDADKILIGLKEKAGSVDWNKSARKEYFCVIAKSFIKKPKTDNCFFFDLGDMKGF